VHQSVITQVNDKRIIKGESHKTKDFEEDKEAAA